MTEREARTILGRMIQDDGSLEQSWEFVTWLPGDTAITLDGHFSISLLQAMVWWTEHHTTIAREAGNDEVFP